MYYLYDKWDNIPRFIAISAAVHLLLIFSVIYLSGMVPVRRFITPVYIVDIFEPILERPKKPVTEQIDVKKTEPASEPITKIEEKPDIETISPPKIVQEAVPSKKEVEIKTPPAQEVDVDIALKRLEEKIRKEDEKESSIQKRVKELEEAQKIQQRIEELSKKAEKKDTIVKKVEKKEPNIKKQVVPEPPQKHALKGLNQGKEIEPAAPLPSVAGKISPELLELEFKAYYLKLRESIYSKWVYPTDSKRNMVTIIGIKISRNGNLMDKYVEKSSGSPIFDDTAKRAIDKAAPFPPLPDSFQDEFMEVGIRFCPYGCPEAKE